MEKEENHIQIEQEVHDAHEQSIEDKIEAMLKLSWVMLPESCSIPCIIN